MSTTVETSPRNGAGQRLDQGACRPTEVAAPPLVAPDILPAIVREVLRHDPPIQNTRRFLIRDGQIMGQSLHEGDAILVVLAAANRGPVTNAAPVRFEPFRADRQTFTFGAGGHACPGAELAIAIAAAGVVHLLASGFVPEWLHGTVGYRASVNARIPMFAAMPTIDQLPVA